METTVNNIQVNTKISGKDLIKLQNDAGDFNVGLNKAREPKKETMGKDEFLKLLVTQLSKQDPLNPMKNTEFIAQMAQFSALEQMYNVSSSVGKLSVNMNRLEAQNLIGKSVKYLLPGTTTIRQGTVKMVKYDDKGVPTVKVGDDSLAMDNILEVTAAAPAQAANSYLQNVKTTAEGAGQ